MFHLWLACLLLGKNSGKSMIGLSLVLMDLIISLFNFSYCLCNKLDMFFDFYFLYIFYTFLTAHS